MYLCRRICQSEYLLCWRSRALWDRLFCTLVFLVLDIPRSQRPKQHPLSSSTCLHGIVPAKAHHTHPHATSCSTAHCANLQKVIVNYFLHNCSWKCEFRWICALSLPTHVRPVLSKVRPSAHSQRKEPCVFTQRPFVHTPGNTSHSFMSTETFSEHHTQSGTHLFFKRSLQGERDQCGTTGAACSYLHRQAPSSEQTLECRWCLRRHKTRTFYFIFLC